MFSKTYIFLIAFFVMTAVLTSFAYYYYFMRSANFGAVKTKIQPTLEQRLLDKQLNLGAPIFIRIFKASKELELWVQDEGTFKLFETYPICAYSGDFGPKLQEGDGQSPEGFYSVRSSQMNPNSNYHLSFNLGFPNVYDRSHGRTGSFLMVHGRCASVGCYAMTDAGIEEIYLLAHEAFAGGQDAFSVHIFPFRMDERNLNEYRDSKWIDFWNNLKIGYDYFETFKMPPKVTVENESYIIQPES